MNGTGLAGSGGFVPDLRGILSPTIVGAIFFLQDLIVDPGAPKQSALSNGIAFTIGA